MGTEIKEGNVVFVPTGQAGTVVSIANGDAQVLLRNGDIWAGKAKEIYLPQSQEHLDAAPIDVDRLSDRKAERRK